jgi:hypothetical protein
MNAVDKEYAKKFKFYEKLGRMRLISFILRNFWLQISFHSYWKILSIRIYKIHPECPKKY